MGARTWRTRWSRRWTSAAERWWRSRCSRQPAADSGERGKRLLRQRGEKLERSFAHLYETGGMRRVHLRRHPNILKRLLVHVAAFNLGLVMRKLLGRGTPRGLQGYEAAQYLTLLRLLGEVWAPSLTWTEDADSLELLEPPRSLPEPSN